MTADLCAACATGDHDHCGMQTWCTCPCAGPPDKRLDLGPCCICEAAFAPVLLIVHARSIEPGKGWGCPVCGLSQDGALAVICEVCESRYGTQGQVETALRFACRGWPGTDGRLHIEDLRGEHVHRRWRHPEVEQIPRCTVLPTDTRFDRHADEGQGCLCSRCGTTIWEGAHAIRAWPESGRYALSYHPVCFGAEPSTEDPYGRDEDADMLPLDLDPAMLEDNDDGQRPTD
jgi:hypothetical protein